MVYIHLDRPDGEVKRISKSSWGHSIERQDVCTQPAISTFITECQPHPISPHGNSRLECNDVNSQPDAAVTSLSECQPQQQPTGTTSEGMSLEHQVIKGGVYNGRIGFFQRATDKMVYIHLDRPDGVVKRISKSSWGHEI
jgi:hypothetical protein